MKNSLITPALACLSLCGCAGHSPQSCDQENIQGIWLAQSESQNGHVKSVSFQYVFKGDRITFTDETGKDRNYSFRLESDANLKLMTIWPDDSPASSTPVSVAYELDADSLTIVVAPPGSRPTEIADKNDQELIVCRRKRL
ncbi:MAG TPA: TIGR03067 domain-containing protein [Phycisphaerales bacterium]